MDLVIKINVDNEAFDIMPERECAALLEGVISGIEGGDVYGKLMDINGNTVGYWAFAEDAADLEGIKEDLGWIDE